MFMKLNITADSGELELGQKAQSVIRCNHLASGHCATSFADFGQCAAPRDARL